MKKNARVIDATIRKLAASKGSNIDQELVQASKIKYLHLWNELDKQAKIANIAIPESVAKQIVTEAAERVPAASYMYDPMSKTATLADEALAEAFSSVAETSKKANVSKQAFNVADVPNDIVNAISQLWDNLNGDTPSNEYTSTSGTDTAEQIRDKEYQDLLTGLTGNRSGNGEITIANPSMTPIDNGIATTLLSNNVSTDPLASDQNLKLSSLSDLAYIDAMSKIAAAAEAIQSKIASNTDAVGQGTTEKTPQNQNTNGGQASSVKDIVNSVSNDADPEGSSTTHKDLTETAEKEFTNGGKVQQDSDGEASPTTMKDNAGNEVTKVGAFDANAAIKEAIDLLNL